MNLEALALSMQAFQLLAESEEMPPINAEMIDSYAVRARAIWVNFTSMYTIQEALRAHSKAMIDPCIREEMARFFCNFATWDIYLIGLYRTLHTVAFSPDIYLVSVGNNVDMAALCEENDVDNKQT